ncbi:hypothetical protein AWN90_32835 [Nocardia terpenica]|uniref:Transposase IS116/IS110/IS902 C-terminal domain-containing protein n=1 Tax=Nocardia terpenica TaxID=455432 RepID=A0A164MJZ5_9NOCA|nr:transposase [Nocardia terpenica]KZM73426.1 hypothetical protein AWN90_32835 [Nocardia terpenica]
MDTHADTGGYHALLRWLESFGTVTHVGVEGTGCYGAGLTRYLRSRSVSVVEVNRPDHPAQATKLALRNIGRRIPALTDEIDAVTKQSTALLEAVASATMALFGVSTDRAGQLLVTAGGNPDRLRSESAFAALCAANPIPASSGKTRRHRLNPFGDRDANAALPMIAVVRMRHDPATRAYVARRTTDGLSKREIIRCLERSIARQAYRAIMTDLAHPQTQPDNHQQTARRTR